MKPKKMLTGLTAVWVLIILLEGVSSIVRAFYTRKMNNPTKVVYGSIRYGKTVLMIILAVFNVLLLSRQLDDF